MSTSYISLELGGQKRGLKYDIGTMRFMNDVYDVDPFTLKSDGTDYKSIHPHVVKIIHVGLLRNAQIKKEPVDFKESDVIEWIDQLESYWELHQPLLAWNRLVTPKAESTEPSANGEAGTEQVTFQ